MARVKATVRHVLGCNDKAVRRVAYTPVVWF